MCLHEAVTKPDEYRHQEDCFYVKWRYAPQGKSQEKFEAYAVHREAL